MLLGGTGQMHARKADHTLAWGTMFRHIYLSGRKVRLLHMDAKALTQLVGSVGFPIVACIGIGWYFVKVQQQNNETISKMSDALNNNTIALTKLAEKIDNGKEG
jgi:hypothetical protein